MCVFDVCVFFLDMIVIISSLSCEVVDSCLFFCFECVCSVFVRGVYRFGEVFVGVGNIVRIVYFVVYLLAKFKVVFFFDFGLVSFRSCRDICFLGFLEFLVWGFGDC